MARSKIANEHPEAYEDLKKMILNTLELAETQKALPFKKRFFDYLSHVNLNTDLKNKLHPMDFLWAIPMNVNNLPGNWDMGRQEWFDNYRIYDENNDEHIASVIKDCFKDFGKQLREDFPEGVGSIEYSIEEDILKVNNDIVKYSFKIEENNVGMKI